MRLLDCRDLVAPTLVVGVRALDDPRDKLTVYVLDDKRRDS